jgi:hypothetical protein
MGKKKRQVRIKGLKKSNKDFPVIHNLPAPILTVLELFAPLFSARVFSRALLLFAGHLLCTGNRTITNCLRVLGLESERRYSKYHDVIRKAKWSPSRASRILLMTIVKYWIGDEPIEIVVDSTLERRKGPKIAALATHRDATLSTNKRKVLSVGHCWLVFCVTIKFPGAKQKWSLPFLSILLRPKSAIKGSRNRRELIHPRRYKKITLYTEQVIHLLRRWLGPDRKIFLIGDSAFCSKRICRACKKRKIVFTTGFRLDAALHDFPPGSYPGRGRPRIVGNRLPNLQDVASDPSTEWCSVRYHWYGGISRTTKVCTGSCLWYHNSTGKPVHIRWVIVKDPTGDGKLIPLLCTDPNVLPHEIIGLYVSRWSIEVTFQEIRAHFKFGTTRTWSDLSLERMAPAIIASYSITCLIAAEAMRQRKELIQPITAAWYQKQHVTFSDVLTYVRLLILNERSLTQSGLRQDMGENRPNKPHPRLVI